MDARGDTRLSCLNQEGVDAAFVSRDPTRPSGAAFVQVDGRGEKQILVSPGANRCLSPEAIGPALDAHGSIQVIVSQLEIPLPAVQAAAGWAVEHGVPFVLNPAPASPLPDELYRRLALIRPNATEAEALTGVRVEDQETAREAARRLMGRGVSVVGIQAGDEGNLLVWREEGRERDCFLPRVPVESVDQTGAGDAFVAALAVMRAEGRSWEEAGRFASAAAALTTTRFGAYPALPHRADVEARMPP